MSWVLLIFPSAKCKANSKLLISDKNFEYHINECTLNDYKITDKTKS